MKTLIFILMVGVAVCANAQTITKEDLKKTVQHMTSLAKELQADLDAATAENALLAEKLASADSKLSWSSGQADTLQAQIDVQAEQLSVAITARQAVEKERDAGLEKLFRAALWLAGAAALLAFLIIFYFSPSFGNPLVTVGVYVAVPALVAGAVFTAFRFL